jgi:hypothetical protein
MSLSQAPINSFSLLTKSFLEYELLILLLFAPLLLLLNTSAIAFLVAYELVPTLNPPYAEWLNTDASWLPGGFSLEQAGVSSLIWELV